MVQPKQTKRRFSPEFKREAIEQVVKYQQSAADVARALELNPSPLRKWIRQYNAEMSGVTHSTDALIRLAKVLHVSLDGLMFDDHERGPPDDLALQFEALSGMNE